MTTPTLPLFECLSRLHRDLVLTTDPSRYCQDCRDAAEDMRADAEMDGWDPDYGHGDEW